MRVTFADIEATDLSASWGRILCCSFIDLDSDKVKTFRFDQKPWKGRNKIDDSKLVVAIRDEIEKVGMLVGWNSIFYDIPMINARLALHGQRPVKVARHLDLMWYSAGSSMRIGSRKLDNVSKYFKSKNQKTPLDASTWQLAAAGDRKAMDAVVTHCEFDVRVTKDVFPHLAPYVRKFVLPLSDWWKFASQIEV